MDTQYTPTYNRLWNREFTLLIGADNWEEFSRWYHYEDIIAHYPIAIYPRTGSDIHVTTLPPTVRLFNTGLYDISSTLVRNTIKAGGDISSLVQKEIVRMAEECYANIV